MFRKLNPLNWLRNLRVSFKIFLLLAVSLGGLLYFALTSLESITRSSSIAESSASLKDFSDLAQQIGVLIDKLRNERDETAGALVDRTQLEALQDRRRETDAAIEDFRNALGAAGIQEILKAESQSQAKKNDVTVMLEKAKSQLAQLDTLRKLIDSGNTNLNDTVQFFANVNSSLFDLITHMSRLTRDVPTSNLLAAYVNLLHAKDQMGLERGYLYNVYKAGGFQGDVLSRYLAARSKRETYEKVFESFATDEQAKQFRRNSGGAAYLESEKLAKQALAQVETEQLTISPAAWWEQAEARVLAIKQAEDVLLETLLERLPRSTGPQRGQALTITRHLADLAFRLQQEREMAVRNWATSDGARAELNQKRQQLDAAVEKLQTLYGSQEVAVQPAERVLVSEPWFAQIQPGTTIEQLRRAAKQAGPATAGVDQAPRFPQVQPPVVALEPEGAQDNQPPRFPSLELGPANAETMQLVQALLADASVLQEIRRNTIQDNNSAERILSEYERLQQRIFQTLEAVLAADLLIQQNPQLLRDLEAFVKLLHFHDFAGQEQALLFTALTDGAFFGDLFSAFVSAHAKSQAFRTAFEKSANPGQATTILQESSALAGVEESANQAIASGATPKLNPAEAGTWKSWMDRRLTDLGNVETNLVKELSTKAETLTVDSKREANATAAIAATVCIVAVLVTMLITLPLTRQVRSITNMLAEVENGNYQARAEVLSGDELGVIAGSLNSMADNTLDLIQTQNQRDQIQASIMKLLDEVSDVADGDLRVEAEVTAEFTGAIADAFNFMIGALREVVRNVQATTLQVNSSAQEIQASANRLTIGSEAQANQIGETTAAIEEMAQSIQQVASNTAESAAVAEDARTNAHKGYEAVRNTIRGMDRIREQVQETAKRIKRLGESSQEIGEFTQLIGDIADRTSILALNASIQAAMAGEAGQGFAVVAEEVERLADRANDAAKQIATLISTIQGETAQAVASMEDNIREVVEGSKVATEAGAALQEIDSVSDRLAELIRSISQVTKSQATGADALTQAMTEISGVTQQSAQGTRQVALAINELTRLATELRESVSTFKLPDRQSDSEHSIDNLILTTRQ